MSLQRNENLSKNADPDFTIVDMRRVEIIIFQLGVAKYFIQKF